MHLIIPQTSILNISKATWDRSAVTQSPFLQYDFLYVLEKSQSIGGDTGWHPLYFIDEDENAIFYTFMKNHSYGEYIFDWQWANAYEKNGLNYYPKLTSMIPFTPVTTAHFIMLEFRPEIATRLLAYYHDFYKNYGFLSSHFLFINEIEIPLFKQAGYLIRESIQYHFFNHQFTTFEDYLLQMKGRKAKQIRKERSLPGIKIEVITNNDLMPAHAEQMYKFYCTTIDRKNSIDYLKKDFFSLIFEIMKKNVLYVQASIENEAVAGSLFFYDSEKLYGRYWGSIVEVENLHFELCFYQGIDFCIKRKLKIFEAGAQGEHKISRGFRPVRTYSAHSMQNEQFHSAIGDYINAEKIQIEDRIKELSLQLPFKE